MDSSNSWIQSADQSDRLTFVVLAFVAAAKPSERHSVLKRICAIDPPLHPRVMKVTNHLHTCSDFLREGSNFEEILLERGLPPWAQTLLGGAHIPSRSTVKAFSWETLAYNLEVLRGVAASGMSKVEIPQPPRRGFTYLEIIGFRDFSHVAFAQLAYEMQHQPLLSSLNAGARKYRDCPVHFFLLNIAGEIESGATFSEALQNTSSNESIRARPSAIELFRIIEHADLDLTAVFKFLWDDPALRYRTKVEV